MEDENQEEGKKSPSHSQSQSQSHSQPQSQVNVPEANGDVPSVEHTSSPSVVRSRTSADKQKSNAASSVKLSNKRSGENAPEPEKVSDELVENPKGSGLRTSSRAVVRAVSGGGGGGGAVVSSGGGAVVSGGAVGGLFQTDFFNVGSMPCAAGLLQNRSPFIHNPPHPEERRARVQTPRTPIDYIINLREDLADFQESHGLPRTRDYSFVSLGLALAQETGRAILSVFQMFTELFPILAIISLILRFALDKVIEILETTETVPKIKKSIIFALEMLAIMIPLWILFGTIIIPLITLILSLFKKVLRIKGGKKKIAKRAKVKPTSCSMD